MFPRIDDSAKLGQQPVLRRWLVFTIVGALLAFSCALLFSSKEAQAKAKHSPGQGSVEGAGKQAGETLRGAGAPAGGREARGNIAHLDPAPQVDKPLSANAEPVDSSVEPLPKTNVPAVEQAGNTLGRVVGPMDEVARQTDQPVLDEATSVAEPVLSETSPAVEPVLEEAVPVVEPVLNEATSVIEPVGEAVEPTAWPLLEAASPTVEPVLGGALLPAEPALSAASPVVEPVFEMATPGLGEEVVLGSSELPVSERIADAAPAFPSTISSPALAVEAWGSTLPDPRIVPATSGNARDSSSHDPTGETRPSTVGLPGYYSESFGRSPVMAGGHHAALLNPHVAKDAQDRTPRPSPFGFPSGTPAGSSLGGSGPSVGLDLLGILALFLILSRGVRTSRSFQEAFKLSSSLRLAIERPG